MNDITIFNQEVPDFLKGELNDLTKSLAGGGMRRISIRGSVFRKIVGGEEVGKITDRELNVIVVNAAKAVGRTFYAGKYNPNEIVPPTCWSNDGMIPDADEGRQAGSCATCPQNIAGSGDLGGRACRYSRRIALVLEGDMSGDVYQLSIPATSLFGKGDGNAHPFESYAKYIAGNGRNINQIVTKLVLDTDSDTPKLVFSPVRHITADEWAVVKVAGDSPDSINAIKMTVAQADGVQKPQIAAPKMEEAEAAPEPTKRSATKTPPPAAKADLADVVKAWSNV